MTNDFRQGCAVSATGWGWRHGLRKKWAVRDLDLNIQPGEKILLLGPSGAGKSTLIHAIAGVLDESQGDVAGSLDVAGKAPSGARGDVGLVIQDPDNQVVLSKVGDEVAFGCENIGLEREAIWERVRWALAVVGLQVPLTHPTFALSGGQKQRLALAAALAMNPKLLLLDEPTANLDPDGVNEVRDAVINAQRLTGATMIVVEHRVEIWSEVVDRIIVLEPGGGLRAAGTPNIVLGEHGRRLAVEGVWVPQAEKPQPLPKVKDPQTVLQVKQSQSLYKTRRSQPLPEHEGGASAPVILRAVDLSIGYEQRYPVQKNINIEIPQGISTCIIGANGAGKSTLAMTLAGLLPQLGGEVEAHADMRALNVHDQKLRKGFVAGKTLPADPHDWASKHLLTRIGTVFQSPEHQFLTGTVVDELAIGPKALGMSAKEVEQIVAELLERLRLAHLQKANPFTLSGGEKRRLSVATVLATAPKVIILDEPTFGQDLNTWCELIEILRGLRERGTTLISVTHDQKFIEVMGENIIEVSANGVRLL